MTFRFLQGLEMKSPKRRILEPEILRQLCHMQVALDKLSQYISKWLAPIVVKADTIQLLQAPLLFDQLRDIMTSLLAQAPHHRLTITFAPLHTYLSLSDHPIKTSEEDQIVILVQELVALEQTTHSLVNRVTTKAYLILEIVTRITEVQIRIQMAWLVTPWECPP